MASSVKDYVPTTQSKQSAWAQNFSAQINASPGAYALSAADATTIANAANDYSNAYTTAVNPPTRTPVTVEQKSHAPSLRAVDSEHARHQCGPQGCGGHSGEDHDKESDQRSNDGAAPGNRWLHSDEHDVAICG